MITAIAQLHVDSGWVPADTSIEEFEFAIRTVCEPIFNKPLAEISFGHVLVNLFNTARRFNMQVQPQLVLLQKTLLYVEGLGRQLYPQLDLWKTAKPFLEDWVKEQVGPLAVMKKMYANLPFWAEKMPELPDLIYQNLKRQQQPVKVPAPQSAKPLLLSIFAGSCLIVSGLCYLQHDLVASAITAGFALAGFIAAWVAHKLSAIYVLVSIIETSLFEKFENGVTHGFWWYQYLAINHYFGNHRIVIWHKKLRGIGGDLGSAVKGFKKAVSDDDQTSAKSEQIEQASNTQNKETVEKSKDDHKA